MPRYRYKGELACTIPELGLDLDPGDEFETDQPVDHPDLEPVVEAEE